VWTSRQELSKTTTKDGRQYQVSSRDLLRRLLCCHSTVQAVYRFICGHNLGRISCRTQCIYVELNAKSVTRVRLPAVQLNETLLHLLQFLKEPGKTTGLQRLLSTFCGPLLPLLLDNRCWLHWSWGCAVPRLFEHMPNPKLP